jgi:hypothetical protein
MGGDGVYLGRERILEYFKTLGAEGPEEGVLNDQMQLQPVIHVLSKTRPGGDGTSFHRRQSLVKTIFGAQVFMKMNTKRKTANGK